VLCACGGGGGGDSPPTQTPPPAPANPAPTPTYAIGGAVAGLSGAGLVLKNGGESLTVGSSTFTFTQRAESGRTYDVSVASQPKNPTQTCVVQRGAGTIGTADVTDMVVQCTTDRFVVGGSVSGLAGAGLRLQDRSGDALAVNANGMFQLPRTMPSGVAYDVQVIAQPQAPGQLCSVASGAGTIADAAVMSIRVTCVMQTFSVGGIVSGLQGAGLVLTSSSGGRLAIDATGSFVLPDALPEGATYDVAVIEQPASAVACKILGRSGRGVVQNSNVTSILVACARKEPPPGMRFCEGEGMTCNDRPPIKVRICPEHEPDCLAERSTRIHLRVDGRRVSGGLVTFNGMMGLAPVLEAGSAQLYTTFVQFQDAPYLEVKTNADVTFSYYEVAPVWRGTTTLDFLSTTRSSSTLDSTFYRHVSYAAPTAADDLFARGGQAIEVEQQMVDATSDKIAAHFIPTELVTLGEGNFSYGDGTVSINYGNPAYIAEYGGILQTALPRFAHENSHELFGAVAHSYQQNSACLNEGIADALAFRADFLPEADFGPVGVRGLSFELDGCLAMTEMHDVGNCPLWHVKKANLLTPAFLRGLFHPQHHYTFDSCTLDRRTGNSLLVLYTEAAGGANMIPVLDAAGIPHAASYQAAKSELGL
jgi:hypothetical protein